MTNRTGKLLALVIAALGCLVMAIVGAANGDWPFAIGFIVLMLCLLYVWSVEYHDL
jgi:hypothetical protein